jgi:hypothetical protein
MGAELRPSFLTVEQILRLFENRVLGRIFGPKREELLHNVELYLYSLPNIIRVIKSWKMRSPRHVERMGDRENEYTFCAWKLEGKGRDNVQNLDIDGRRP